MLLRIREINVTPPGYWRFPRHPGQPLTGDESRDFIRGGDFTDLVKKVHEFRVANRYDLGDPEAEIQDWICRNTGARCAPANPAKPLPGRKPQGGDVVRFLSAMTSWMARGGHVEQEEAERRAERCAGCQHNTILDDSSCAGCFGLIAKIANVIGGRKTRLDESLHFCNICGCSGKIQVWVPMEVLARAHKLGEFPTDIGDGHTPCWKREYADSVKP